MKNLFIGFAAICMAMSFWVVNANAASLEARIDLSTQTMTVVKDGMFQYRWRVSTARKGYVTPTGRYTVKWASRYHRSRKYHNSPMPYSLFFKGGYAVHGTNAIRHLGHPASHGCVRLLPEHAAKLFSLAKSVGLHNTQIVITR